MKWDCSLLLYLTLTERKSAQTVRQMADLTETRRIEALWRQREDSPRHNLIRVLEIIGTHSKVFV